MGGRMGSYDRHQMATNRSPAPRPVPDQPPLPSRGADASLSILRVARLAIEVGFPDGALNIVTGLGRDAGVRAQSLARDPRRHAGVTGRDGGDLAAVAVVVQRRQ